MFARNPLTTQLVSAVGGRRTMVGAQRFSPLLGAPPTHGVLQVRAASSKKKDKAGGKKKKNTGAPKKSRYGPRGPDGAPSHYEKTST